MIGLGDDCAAISELVGAYALDALEPEERAAVEQHIARCPRCAQELDEYRQTVGALSAAGGAAPDGVWERIALSIEGDTGPTSIPELPRLSGPGRVRRRRWETGARIAVAAAAVAAAAVLGVQSARIDHLDHQVKQLNSASQQSAGFEGLVAALVDPTARHLVLASTTAGAAPVGQLVILPSGGAYLVGSRLASLPPGRTYQMWSVEAGRTVSVSLLGAHPGTVAFRVDPAASAAYLVTVEPAGGVVAPTTAPVARSVT